MVKHGSFLTTAAGNGENLRARSNARFAIRSERYTCAWTSSRVRPGSPDHCANHQFYSSSTTHRRITGSGPRGSVLSGFTGRTQSASLMAA